MIQFNVETKPHIGPGIQAIYRFENGMGASVIPEYDVDYGPDPAVWNTIHGEYEIAVTRLTEDGFNLCYCTPIANDVLRNVNESEVYDLILQINNLPITECRCHGHAYYGEELN